MPKRLSLESSISEEIASSHAEGLFTACYFECGFLFDKHPKIIHHLGCEATATFDLASLTKVLCLSPLAFKAFPVDTQIETATKSLRLPESLGKVTIRELLSHRSGLPAWRNFWVGRIWPDSTLAELEQSGLEHIETVFHRLNFEANPGSAAIYSDVGMILLGYILQRHHSRSLESLFDDAIGRKVRSELSHEFLGGPKALAAHQDKVVPTSFCSLRDRVLKAEVHDENAFALGGFPGHAGLFGSGAAVGYLIRRMDLFPELHALYQANSSEFLGFRPGTDSGSMPFGGGEALGHLGFTGTAFWIEPKTGKYVVLLTNRVVSGRVSAKIQPFRARVMALANQLTS